MEFHETMEVPWNVEWHEIPRIFSATKWTITKFHRILWNSMTLWYRQIKYHSVPWNSIPNGSHFKRAPFQMTQVFHGIPWNIPWNSGAAKWNITKFPGSSWNSKIVILFNTMLPWTSMGYSMEFHETLESPNKKSPSSMGFHGVRRAPFQMTQVFHGSPWNIPWNSMELWYRQTKYNLVPWNSMEYSMESHGTVVPPNEISLSSMEFQIKSGTLRK